MFILCIMQRLYLTGNGQTGTTRTDAYSQPKEPWKCGADGKASCEEVRGKNIYYLKKHFISIEIKKERKTK